MPTLEAALLAHEGIANVKAFGATGNGTTDDTAAIQSAIDSGEPLYFPPTDDFYKVQDDPLELPLDRDIHVEGRSSHIKTATTNTPLFSRVPANQTAADAAIGNRLFFKGLILEGVAGVTLIDAGPSYGSVFEQLYFIDGDTGLDLQFCLMASVVQCRAVACRENSFVAQQGQWTGAGTSNSQSNHTVFQSCRVYNRLGANAAFKVHATSGVGIYDCISEGANSDYGLDFDALASTVVKTITVRNFHCENQPTEAIIKAKMDGGGHGIFENIFFQAESTIIDVTGSNSGAVIDVRGIPYFVGASHFKHGASSAGPRWEFRGNMAISEVSDSAYWTGGIVPEFLLYDYYSDAGAGMVRAHSLVHEIRGSQVRFLSGNGNTVIARFAQSATDDDTSLLMLCDGAEKRVVVGAADSGGSGYRMLRIAN